MDGYRYGAPPGVCLNIHNFRTIFVSVDGYSYGAPPGVCLNIHNVHGLWKPQTSECPFKLRYETPTYSPSQEVNGKYF